MPGQRPGQRLGAILSHEFSWLRIRREGDVGTKGKRGFGVGPTKKKAKEIEKGRF